MVDVYGYAENDMDAEEFMMLGRYCHEAGYRHAVHQGLGVTPGPGVRETVVGSGIVSGPNLVAIFDDAMTLTHAANPGAASRVDYVVCEFKNQAPYPDPVRKVVTGLSSAIPGLTHEFGGVWQVPLTTVLVPGSYNAAFTANHLVRRAPVPRAAKRHFQPATALSVSHNSSGSVIATINVPDYGWPVLLQVNGTADLSSSAANGRAALVVKIDGTEVARGNSGTFTGANEEQPTRVLKTIPHTGPATVTLTLAPNGLANGQLAGFSNGAANFLEVVAIPA